MNQPVPSGGALRPADPERQSLIERWAERHGVEKAASLASAEALADAVQEQLVPENTADTYAKSWKVWERFCAESGLPETEGTRGSLVSFVMWMVAGGKRDGTGYAPKSAGTHLAAAVVGIRRRGGTVSVDDQAQARAALGGLEVKMLKAGERRGRGQAPAADLAGLRQTALACPDTLTGLRTKALVLVDFHMAGRSSEPAGLFVPDIVLDRRGLAVDVLTGKTKHSVRNAKIRYQNDPEVCPVRAYVAYRQRLVQEAGPQWAEPGKPAFVRIDRWGNVTGGLTPEGVSRIIKRAAEAAGVEATWTAHSMRAGLASESRRRGADAIIIARQGGWAPHSRSMLGYMRVDDDWDDNVTKDLS